MIQFETKHCMAEYILIPFLTGRVHIAEAKGNIG
jgi:hypothetical protein